MALRDTDDPLLLSPERGGPALLGNTGLWAETPITSLRTNRPHSALSFRIGAALFPPLWLFHRVSPRSPERTCGPPLCRAGLLSAEKELRARACSPGAPWPASEEGRGCCRQRSLVPTTRPHRSPSSPSRQRRPCLGLGRSPSASPRRPLPEITTHEAMGLAGLGLPGDECLPAHWTTQRAQGSLLPGFRPGLRGHSPRVRVHVQQGAAVAHLVPAPERCSELGAQGMSTGPSPRAFFSFCLISPRSPRGGSLEQGKESEASWGSWLGP